MLLALGYEGTPDEEITLRIIPSVEYRSSEEPKELTYSLCGVIKDYQINWETSVRNRMPAGIVSTEGAGRIGGALETHMLIKAKEGCESVYEELEKSKEISCKIEENFNRGSLVMDNIPFEKFLDNIRLLVAGAAICILFITLSHSIDTRKNFWKFLDALGMEKKQMYQMIVWEAGIYGAVSVSIGTLGGIILYKVTLPLFENIIGKDMITHISRRASVNGIFYSALIIGISYFFSCMRLNDCLKERRKSKKQKRFRKKKAYAVSRFTPLSVVMQQWRYTGIRKVVQILLLTSVIVVAGSGMLETHSKQESLKVFEQMTGNGYYLDTQGVPNSQGIRKTTVQALTQIAGVDSIESYYNTLYNTNETGADFTVDLSEYSDSKYIWEIVNTEQYYRENTDLEKASIEKITLNVFGITRWEDMERFARNLSEGRLTRTDFERGDYCILLLPPHQKVPEGYLGNPSEEAYTSSFLTESRIMSGDMLKITHWKQDGEKEVQQIPIDAIIRTVKQEDIRSPYPGGAGICIIAGDSFWKKFRINAVNDYCQQVRVNVSDDADVLDTEKHLLRNLRKTGTVNLSNFHQEYNKNNRICIPSLECTVSSPYFI